MAYTEVDQLAINTIRVLAVCFFLSFLFTRSVGVAAVLVSTLSRRNAVRQSYTGTRLGTAIFFPGVSGDGVVGEKAFDSYTQLWRDGPRTSFLSIINLASFALYRSMPHPRPTPVDIPFFFPAAPVFPRERFLLQC